MSTKVKYSFLIIAVLILIAGIVFLCWLHVDGDRLPLPEGSGITGYATRILIGLDETDHTPTHDTISFDMTDTQVAEFLQLLRQNSYWRTRHGSSVSFNGDVWYTVTLAYQAGSKQEFTMISVLDNEMINILVGSDTSSGYLKITDPDFLAKLQAILET